MTTLIKLLDANITDIIFETQIVTRSDGYCETCYYEYDVLEGRIGFTLDDGTEHILTDFSDVDEFKAVDAVGISTADMFRVFLDHQFLDLLANIKLENLNSVLAQRLYDLADTNRKKNLLQSTFYEYLKNYDYLEDED